MDDSAGVLELWYNDNYVFVTSNNLAYFQMGPWDTNIKPLANSSLFKIPRTVVEDLSGDKNTAETGTIGVGVDGVSIFSETTSNSYDNAAGNNEGSGDGIWNEDAWLDEAWSMDTSGNGHGNASGKYHYHASPKKLYGDMSEGHSPIIGWGLDGVPIYGPYGYRDSLDKNSPIVRIESSYQLRSISDRTTLPDGTVLTSDEYGPSLVDYELGTYVEDYEYVEGLGHLDEHNGRWCVTPEYPSGVYAYFITEDAVGDPAFPYVIGPEFYGETASGNSIPKSAEQYDPLSCDLTFVKSSNSDNSISIYPNPSNGLVNMNLGTLLNEKVQITVFNIFGQEVFRKNTLNTQSVQLNFNAIPGNYLVKVVSENDIFSEVIVIK